MVKEENRPKTFFAFILTPRSLVWKWVNWNSPLWKVCAIQSHSITHFTHELAFAMHTLYTLCIRYSYARIRYAYVMDTLLIRSQTLCIRYSYACLRYAFGDTGFNAGPSSKARVWTLKSCAYEHFFLNFPYVTHTFYHTLKCDCITAVVKWKMHNTVSSMS